MKKIIIIFIIHCSLLITNCMSQSITWQRTYDRTNYDECRDICAADNGNFYVVGYIQWNPDFISYILKLNPYGDTLWSRVINTSGNNNSYATAVTSSGDGGCVITGYHGPSSFAVKIDLNGNIVWTKLYGSTSTECLDIIKTSDGGYAACGNRFYDGYVFKTDSLGNLLWQKYYPAIDIKDFKSMVLAPEGNLVITGIVHDYPMDTFKILLLKLDTSGNIIWDKRFKVNNGPAIGRKVDLTNGGYLIGGAGGNGVCFVRTNFNGDLLFETSYESTKPEYLMDIKYLSPNRYVISVLRDSGGATFIKNAIVNIIDSNGNILTNRRFNTKDYCVFNGILPLSNGDLIFAGEYEYRPMGFVDIYVARTDSLLNAPPIGIIKNNNQIPTKYKLYQNYPNPFNSRTVIKFDIPAESEIIIKIYDLLGREIEKIADGKYEPGSYQINYNAGNLSSGVYFYTLISENYIESKKFVLIK